MSSKELSATALCELLGERIRQARLNLNLTQKDTAQKAGLSVKAVQSVEAGTATLHSVVATLQALDLTDQLSLFLPMPEVSPVQLAKLKGKQRKRASGGAEPYTLQGQSSW